MIRQSFNDGWSFQKGGSGFLDMLHGTAPKTVPVQLPHDAMIHEAPDPSAVSGGQTGFYPGGQYTYTKAFYVPAEWEGHTLLLEFEGVYMTAMVYVNGSHAATNLYGYSGFYVRLDDIVRFGQTNEIKVIVNNPAPNSRWYSGSGIYRPVNLLVGGDVHILADGVKATTLLASPEEALLQVETRLINLTRSRQTVDLRMRLAFKGQIVKEDTVHLSLFSQDRETVRQNVRIPDPCLWNVDTPDLYDLTVEVLREGRALDAFEERIGLRTLTLDADKGLRINGVPVKQKGTCIHHDNGVIGAATFQDAEERRARLLKEAGFNAIRSAHHPMSREMLRACDQYGLLVMDELTDMWYEQKNTNDFSTYFDVCWQQEIERMVAKDYNHPCVVLYSTGNEITDLGHETGARINRRLCNRFHELDATRYTTTAVNGMMNAMNRGTFPEIMQDLTKQMEQKDSEKAPGDSQGGVGEMNAMMSLTNTDAFSTHPKMTEALEEPAQAADVAGFNYLTGRHGELERRLHPNKPVLGTETYPADIVRLWRIVEENSHVLGDYTWTGYDYLGEAGCGIFYYDGTVNFSSHFPDRIAYIGDLDILGTRRPISFLRQTVFGERKEPYIAVIRLNRYGLPHSQTAWMYKDNVSCWTWPGYEGRQTDVEVYSVDEEVELFRNGVSLGQKPAGRDHGFTAVYEGVTYEPGELLAVAYSGGRETGRFLLKTAAQDTILTAEADSVSIPASTTSLAFVTCKLTDGHGVDKLAGSRSITVKVEGEGVLQGFGSAEPQPTAGYDDTTWPTYDGRVMAVVRSNGNPGTIRVTFTAEGLAPAVVTIETRQAQA